MTDIQLRIKAAIERHFVADTEYRLAFGEHLKADERLSKAVAIMNEARDALVGLALPDGTGERLFNFGGSVVRVARLAFNSAHVEVIPVEDLK